MSPPRRPSSRAPLVPSRIRCIGGESFSFVPHRFLRDGFLASLDPAEQALYLFLVLAGDRHGVSFYNYDRICTLMRVDLDTYLDARNGLIQKDLIAFDGTRFQVLSLPQRPVRAAASEPVRPSDSTNHDNEISRDPAIRAEILAALRRPTDL